MSDMFETFIVDSIRRFMTELNKNTFERTVPNTGHEAILDTVTIDRNSPGAETRHDVTLFADETDGQNAEWLVFYHQSTDAQRGVDRFAFGGRLPSDASDLDFVDAAHHLLLFRAPDQEGQNVLATLMRDRGLSRRDLLSIIAWSCEASSAGLRALIFQATSLSVREHDPASIAATRLEARIAA